LARDWTEFLTFAPRTPVVTSDLSGGAESPLSDDEKRRGPAFDEDATGALNSIVPLRLWLDATTSSLLPRSLRAKIAQAGWVRAVILGDSDSARRFAQRLVTLKPELDAEMRAWLAEADPAAANFDAAFLMLRAPGFEPEVRAGWGRDTDVLKRDEYRDNWWSLSEGRVYSADRPDSPDQADLYPKRPFFPQEFLSDEQRQTGVAERAQIAARAKSGVDYLCTQAIAWARAHSTDPRVPRALYLAVEATHYGPSTPRNPLSKQAFELLHLRYPDSEWAAKTKYWY
jgi:hypothetical protein